MADARVHLQGLYDLVPEYPAFHSLSAVTLVFLITMSV